ncbi:uncharacterized protein K444DRAFT_621929 [Hyaloscypha bicolor E]|uniref:Heterokaryon incompatibility domain-containing protein n=1 Tax=Hyaloscypha bicolor E TaxID=1095630 RepID=A0A2J6SIG5_9HELO|nr:uncharacterized protein K444DRAFT_621929 [Hyaloscypha bicolor E]PMD50557.1 hypothetical protein K444DRAFT_621929 [Hyaloscypha bicolor E]
MSAEDLASNNNPGRRRKRNRNQSPEARKKPRLDEGTSHPVQAKKQLQQATISVLKYLGKRPDTFVYPPLEEKNGQEIRVLIIEPGKGDDEIRCKLVPAALPKSDPSDTEKYVYIALSYNWGEGQPIHPITITNYITSKKRMKEPSLEKRLAMKFRKHKDWCSSGEKYVRSNLFVALKRFRRKDKETIMWIDALCIDQDDPHERSAQVKQMHELYIQAEKVRIWLGDGSTAAKEGSPKDCFNFLRRILGELDKLLDDLGKENTAVMEAAKQVVVQLMCNKWFSRRWIIQELALARTAEVVYGNQTMPWSDFADAIAIFIKSQDRIGAVLSKMIADQASSTAELGLVNGVTNLGANALVDFINNLFRRTENGDIQQRMLTLECLVSNLLAFEATNPRDTIYAVLSLAKDTHKLSTETNVNAKNLQLDKRLLPAYQNCLLDVYTDFIDYCIGSSRSLDILLRHWARSEESDGRKALLSEANSDSEVTEERLPTWIPLIHKSPFGLPTQRPRGRSNGDSFAGTSFRSSQRNYNATLSLRPEFSFGRMAYSSKTPNRDRKKTYNGTLFVRGLRIGKVKKTTPRAAQGMLFNNSLNLAGFDIRWWEDHHEWAKGIPRVPERFWRTIVADRGPDGSNPPSWYPRACLECLYNVNSNGDLRPDDVIDLKNASSIAKLFLARVKDVVWGRRIVSIELENEKTTFGLLPPETKKGDIVCVFFGCSVPVVLRQQEEEEEEEEEEDNEEDNGKKYYFHMIGECFIYGMMDGEAVADRKWKRPYRHAEQFVIK